MQANVALQQLGVDFLVEGFAANAATSAASVWLVMRSTSPSQPAIEPPSPPGPNNGTLSPQQQQEPSDDNAETQPDLIEVVAVEDTKLQCDETNDDTNDDTTEQHVGVLGHPTATMWFRNLKLRWRTKQTKPITV